MVLALGAVAAAYRASAPSFVAGALSSYLGRRVEIGALEFHPGQALVVELSQVRVYEGPEAEGLPMLELPHAIGTQAWPRLLVGQVIPLKWEIDAPVLRTTLAADSGAGTELALPRVPPLDLLVRKASLVLRRPDGPPLRVTELDLVTTRSRLRTRVAGSARGLVSVGLAPLARFSAQLEGWRSKVELSADVSELDLSVLSPEESTRWQGMASGRIEVRLSDGRIDSSLDLDVDNLQIEVAGFRAPIAPRRTRLVADVSFDGREWIVRPRPVALDDVVASGELRIRTEAPARFSAAIDLASFAPGVPSLGTLHPISLLGLRHQVWADLDQRIEAGFVEGVHIDIDLPLADLGQAISFRRKLEPNELRLTASVRGGVYRTGLDSAPIEDISGDVVLSGNVIRVQNLTMTREGDDLPHLDVTVDGMHRLAHLPVEERGRPAGPGVGIPGLGAATDFMQQIESSDRPKIQIRFSDAQVGYHAFLLPIRNARGVIRFPDDTLVIEDADAVVGGVPGLLSVTYDPGANTIVALVRYGDDEAPPREDPGPYWISGRFAVDPLWLGDWRLDRIAGELRGRGARVEVTNYQGRFATGPIGGSGWISLADPQAAEFEFLAGVHHASGAGLCQPMERSPGSIQGQLTADGVFRGSLDPNREFLETADFGISLLLQDGTLDELPALIVLARLPSLQGLKGLFGSALPFDALSTDIFVHEGKLHIQNLGLQGPELRMHARGEIDLLTEESETDMVLAFFFLQTIDKVIGTVPVVGDWMLGADQSLVAIYLQMTGPWENPNVRPLPPDSVASAAGWAVNLVASGANQLIRFIFSRDSAGDDEPEAGEEPADDPGPGQDP